MDNRLQALQDLLAKVEAKHAKFTPSVWFREDADKLGLSLSLIARSYLGSLDATVSLRSVVLPNSRARLDIGRRFRAWVISPDNEKWDAYADNPARAWLIAILKALISEASNG